VSATTVPTPEQQQRAKWDLLLLDLEQRAEQVRQLRVYEPRRLVIQGLTAGAALLAAGAALGGTLIALLLRMHS
jgi:hypothetical protein